MHAFLGKAVKKLPLLFLAAALLLGFLIFWYEDIGDTLDNSVMLVETVKDGSIRNFYEYAAKNAAESTEYSANYNIIVYFVFALWNLPTALIHIFTGFDYTQSLPALLWCKAMILVVYAFLAREMMALMKILSPDDKYAPKLSAYLMLSSLCVFVPAMVAAQYDCLSLLFMLMGLKFYAQKKDLAFVLAFAVSVPFKLFSLFIYLPLLLLRYKNVLRILVRLLPVLLLSVLPELPFRGEPFYEAALQSQNGDAIRLILNAVISVDGMQLNINLFLIAYFVLCLFAYCRKEKTALNEAKMSVYLSFAAFSAFISLTNVRSYWIVLYVPFLSMLAALSKNRRFTAVFTDTLAGVGGGLYVLANHWIYNTGEIMHTLLLRNLTLPENTQAKYATLVSYTLPVGTPEPVFGHFAGFLDSFGIVNLRFIFIALFIACVLFALWKLHPLAVCEEEKREKGVKILLFIRPFILMAVTLMMIFVNFASVPKTALAVEPTRKAETPLQENAPLSVSIRFPEDTVLTGFSMPVETEGIKRTARSIMKFTLSEASSEEPVWEAQTGIATLMEKKELTIEIDKIPVFSEKEYILTLEYLYSDLFPIGSVYPYLTEDTSFSFSFR